jgi:glycogen(starch) synthase
VPAAHSQKQEKQRSHGDQTVGSGSEAVHPSGWRAEPTARSSRNTRVLIFSPAFFPAVGGLETATSQLASGLDRLGCEVVVVTQTPHQGPEPFDFPVVRRPTRRQLLHWVRWSDLYYQANVSLRGLWPLLLVRRPWAVSHHSWYRREDGRIGWRERLKRKLLRFAAASISVSSAMAADLETPSVVIPNGYREDLFRRLPHVARCRDLAFLGRLVSEKGIDTLLAALTRLGVAGIRPRLTIIGDGPEAPRIRRLAAQLGLGAQVELVGMRHGEALVELLNQHRILVVPSRYNEPFGIVALEAIACGCVVVGSWGGGLAEAIGPCGPTFRNGEAGELAVLLIELLSDPDRQEWYRRQAPGHLREHVSERVARRYLAVFSAALQRDAQRRLARLGKRSRQAPPLPVSPLTPRPG